MSSSLHDEMAELLADLRQQQERLAAAVTEMRAVTASATTKDRMLNATVDARGRLTELVFRGNRWRELAPKELAARVVDVVGRAQDKAAASVAALTAAVMPDGVDVAQIMEKELDLRAMLPDDPWGPQR